MPTIVPDAEFVTVIVTLDAPPDLMPDLQSHARSGIDLFARCEGYLGGALHVSTDGSRLVQYLQWSSEAEYQRCIDDPSWDELPSTRRFFEIVNSGQATIDARIFRVLAAFEAKESP